MRLHRDRSVRHRTRHEPTDDLVPGLDLVDRNRRAAFVVKIEKTTKGDVFNLLMGVLRVGVVGGLILLPDGILEAGDTGGVVDVGLASVAPVVL